ncbi:alanine--glyoxylate aminotransferase 2, mitochondrial-like [Paramacrobiotus metropolitanus]|uniref:alanine--glyoxylate aminotransferase 2, mitochondrial-like n=1 Tax=Paramacrobiotus metropolitanus TaxID=2943436 RepID=UPI002445F2A5|nr:alanine--glyoxylate aminotransferase 2, mitochondrial-like [Paramacrobiotus metropolitanus]
MAAMISRRYLSSTTRLAASVKGAPEMPGCDFKPVAYKGLNMEETVKLRKSHLFPSTQSYAYYKKPLMIHQGHMQWLWDHAGKRYLDMFAGIVTVSVGHCHPKVLAAAEGQLKKLWHTTSIYMYPGLQEYVEKLTSKMPGNLKNVYLVNSGSEANDLAMLLARLHSGCYDIIGLRSAYHGTSPNLLGLTALSTWHYNLPVGFGIHHTMNPDPYRGIWGGKYCRDSPVQTTRNCDCQSDKACEAGNQYIAQLEDVLRFCCPKGRIGGMFAESIQGVGGTIQFPKTFLQRAFKIIRDHGGVCISDEVQTGFGRTGEHYWGFEAHGVVPDIVTMAKGIGNGYPMAAVVTTPEIAKSLAAASHFNTFGGGPLACAIGSAVLDVIDEEGLQQNCAKVGTHFLEGLAKLQENYEIIGDVRGKGLMVGVEMVKDRKSKTPLPAADMAEIWETTKDLGVLIGKGGYYGNVFRIKPPMCITKEDVDFTLDVFKTALDRYSGKR